MPLSSDLRIAQRVHEHPEGVRHRRFDKGERGVVSCPLQQANPPSAAVIVIKKEMERLA
jgi:hypothetical protein